MILDRIIKGFWGRYFFYLSVFVAVYFLMRNAIDNALYSLGSLLFGQLEGCHSVIAWIVLAFLVIDPIYRGCTKKVTVVNQPLLAFVLIPASAWYTVQTFVPQTEKYILFDLLYIFILLTTLAYSSIIAFERFLKRPNKKNSSSLLKDDPINEDSKDELGFTIYAESIANNIKGIVGNERSFVFGIEGSWGSGKTSFINMVKERLKKDKEIRIVDFNPWMSSSSKQITSDFFKRMTEEVSGMLLKTKFREYGKLLAAADKTGIVEKVVDKISTSQDLGTTLESINYCIEREKLRFVVFIDDTDRLDKEELLAMFKLVRNTANFRNTVFVLTYDREYVETVLQKYFDDERTAKAYPDKIVNFQFELPFSTKNYYEILKEKINHSEFIKAHQDIRLNDGDLPKEITALFDSYRKVKRVFNALAFESGFPHFEKIPVKYTLVFFYISYYRKDEYEMIRKAYINYNNNIEIYDFLDKSIAKISPLGEKLLRIIEHNNQVTKPKVDDSKKQLNEKEKEEERKYNRFKADHICIYTLLEDKNNGAFIKYLEYLFKFNAIHYKKYKKRYETYGINGYKGINLELSDAEKILNRLKVIRANFPKTFYDGSCDELLKMFTSGKKKAVKKEELNTFCEFLFSLLLNFNNPDNYIGNVLDNITHNYIKLKLNVVNIFTFFDNLDGVLSPPNTFSEYYKKTAIETRYKLVTLLCNEILSRHSDSRGYLSYSFSEISDYAALHLGRIIDNEGSYDLIEEAFLACRGLVTKKQIFRGMPINTNACARYNTYIKEKPDDFIEYCIRNAYWEANHKIILHPFLMQIFSNSKEEVRNYFASVECKRKKSQFMLRMIREHLEKYLSDDIQNSEYMAFQIDKDDYNRIFNYSEEKDEHLEPSLPSAPTEVSK